jgi:hypothetical protein
LIATEWGSTVTLYRPDLGTPNSYSVALARTQEGRSMAISPGFRVGFLYRAEEDVDISGAFPGMVRFKFSFLSGFTVDCVYSGYGKYILDHCEVCARQVLDSIQPWDSDL